MDFDSDGLEDILTGSYDPGELYFFKRNADKTFAKGETIKHTDGKAICIEAASTAFAVDWDQDGDLDLLVGDIMGRVHFVANESSGKELKFGKPVTLQQGGEDINAGHGDSHPIAADWDQDGKLDLLVGSGNGEVLFLRNTGEKGKPALAEAVKLLGEAKGAWGEEPAKTEVAPGARVKICVADYNGDGALDLLVGDFGMSGGGPKPDLTDEQKKRFAEVQQEMQAQGEKMSALYQKHADAALKALGKKEEDLTDEDRLKLAEDTWKALEADPEYKKLDESGTKLWQELEGLSTPREDRGNVWLLAGKPKTDK